ncbi:MAG: ATP-binding protein [Bacteroidales bacterium]|nr:ATP-binding protein [Bacteroidales bacterium]
MESKDQKYLRSLIAEGEHQELDFKFEISDVRKIARTLSAFSNTNGGRLLIGVKDNGRISGVRSDEEFYMVESAASLYCRPEVTFESRSYSIEGKNVLEIYIPQVERKPVFARDEENRWMAYIRVADQNILASIIQLEVWKDEKGSRGKLLKFTRHEEILLRYLEEAAGAKGAASAASQAGATLSKIQRDTGFQRKELVSLITKLVLFDVVEMQVSQGMNWFRLKEKPGE